MKNLLFTVFTTLIFAANSFAELRFIPLEEAVENTDLVIVGTLKDISEKSEDFATIGKGRIVVDQFIAGNILTKNRKLLKFGDEIKLNYVEDFACVMGSHKRIENEKGVFLLNLNDEGEIESKDFRSLHNLAKIKKLLKKGNKINKAKKEIKILNFEERLVKTTLDNQENNSTVKCVFGVQESKPKEYNLLGAFLVVLTSMFLYRFLYRNRLMKRKKSKMGL